MGAMPLANRNSENGVDDGVDLSVSRTLGAGVAGRSTRPGSVSADPLPAAVEPSATNPQPSNGAAYVSPRERNVRAHECAKQTAVHCRYPLQFIAQIVVDVG